MCGICGKLNFDHKKPVEPQIIKQMCDIIAHRGPDGEGVYLSGSVGLGHRRLSIIDLSTGDQPMCNEDGSIWIVYNGEVYNFGELRGELEKRGHKFKSTTDTEVIIHLYEELGQDCVKHLRGMFSFALWDENQKSLLLARDRVGIKPLYYANTGESLLFGSEIKSIILDSSFKKKINHFAIEKFLSYYYVPGEETMFSGIFKLMPGHYLIARDGAAKIVEYWDLKFPETPRDVSFNDAVGELQVLLKRTVKDHMISDVPIGVLLSGGVDSTGVLRYAAEQTDRQLHSFTIGFDGEGFADERYYANIAAKKFGTSHHEISMNARDFESFLPKYIWHMEEPVCEPPAIALYFLASLAREHSVKVLLSGEGGDEVFGGYQNYRNLILLENLKRLLGPAKGFLKFMLLTTANLGLEKCRSYSELIEPSIGEYYFSRTSNPASIFNRCKSDLYFRKPTEVLRHESPTNYTKTLFEKVRTKALLNQMLYVDTKTWLPDDLLVKADKITMATSVELRVPLLDYQIIEFGAALPTRYKVDKWRLKRILKQALRESVPDEILNRKKTGFPVPYARWLSNELREFAFDTILVKNSFLRSFIDLKTAEKILRNSKVNSKEIFCMIVLELWHRTFWSSEYER
jgi:asparagine synthase (glutamine-hydrolysing)